MEQTNNNHTQAAKFAFFYMLSLVALVFMALSTGMIIFQIINKSIVDVLEGYGSGFSDSALKFAISALIISAPIFYVTMWQIQKNLFAGKLDKDSGVRRWLTYFILLVASVVMIGWLIGTLNSFFEGELTLKFALKALTAIGISAAIFSFYLYDIRRTEIRGRKDRVVQGFFYASLAVVLAAFAWSLFVVESPFEARQRRLDQMIINDFSELDGQISGFYSSQGRLPDELQELKSEFTYLQDEDLVNPVNQEPYQYRISGDKEYELCTTFLTSTQDYGENNRWYNERWPHEAGEQCLKRKVQANGSDFKPIPLPR